jgi:hypothetical protein
MEAFPLDTLPQDRTGIRRENAADDFDQRGLSGAVFAYQGMNLTGLDAPVRSMEHFDTVE